MAAPLDALMMERASIARTMHEVTVLPSRCTVHAPPSHTSFVPVNPRCSRSARNSVTRGSTERRRTLPFILS